MNELSSALRSHAATLRSQHLRDLFAADPQRGERLALDAAGIRVLRPLQAAACTYRIAFGPRAGQKVLTLQGAMPRETDFKQTLCADISGFSLHAAVRCGADDRQALEQLCRYITRPALANERVQTNAAGQVVLKLKTPWRDGTTHLVMSPLVFLQRLAALVPRPRLHLIRFHGVVAPNARLRAQVVPQGPAGEGLAHEASVVEDPAAGGGDGQAWARPAGATSRRLSRIGGG